MLHMMFALALLGTPDIRPLGKETTIPFASNGGLRDWQAGPAGSNIVYVRDRTERWYAVTLTGPCAENAVSETINYTTDNLGAFDRFSHISILRYPDQVCGVTSIRTSAPPPGRVGAPKARH